MSKMHKSTSLTIASVAFASLLLAACGGNVDSESGPVADVPANGDCLWVGPYVKENEGFNFAYPDSGAVYWSAAYTLPEDGSYITLEAQYRIDKPIGLRVGCSALYMNIRSFNLTKVI